MTVQSEDRSVNAAGEGQETNAPCSRKGVLPGVYPQTQEGLNRLEADIRAEGVEALGERHGVTHHAVLQHRKRLRKALRGMGAPTQAGVEAAAPADPVLVSKPSRIATWVTEVKDHPGFDLTMSAAAAGFDVRAFWREDGPTWQKIAATLGAEFAEEKRLEDFEQHPWKRDLLPKCHELALLPVGAGDKGKAPVDLKTGKPLSGWQEARFTVKELQERNGFLRGVGFRPGPESGHIAVLDIDGAEALALCEGVGCRIEDVGWVTRRSNASDRLKVAFRIPEAKRLRLVRDDGKPIGKVVLTVRPPNKEKGIEGQQLELFYGSGQCIIAGEHQSGGAYVPEGSPETVAEPNEAWWTLIQKVLSEGAGETESDSASLTDVEIIQSGPGFPCPVCGRNTSSACTVFLDDDRPRVNCHHGNKFAPPMKWEGVQGEFLKDVPLEPGDVITAADGKKWAFTGTGVRKGLGAFSKFRLDGPLESAEKIAEQAVGGAKQLGYKGLLRDCLAAIVDGDEDRHMQRVAELKIAYRLSDEQIQSRLLRLHMEGKVQKTNATSEGVDLDQIEQLDYAMDGWIPKGALRMTYGCSGTGKTTLCVWTAHNHVQGVNILDREAPCPPGKALFIATDSGAGPLKKALADLGIDPKADPIWRPGPEQRIWVWAHAPEQGHEAWLADIKGLIRLETFIQRNGITYVAIDSAKSTTADVFSYTSNESVKALMRYMQNCICEPLGCCIDWINHDGTEKGAAAGAKAWREDPSMVVRLSEEKDSEERQIGVRVQFVKDRAAVFDPKRTLVYRLTEGVLELAPYVEVVGTCEEQILEILWQNHRLTDRPISTAAMMQEALQRYGRCNSTVENTLPRLVQARAAKVVRARRGFYALAPSEAERRGLQVQGDEGCTQAGSLKDISTLWGVKEVNPLQQKGSDNPPPTPHRGVRGVPPTRLGTEANPPQPPTGDWPGGCQNADAASDVGLTPPADIHIPIQEVPKTSNHPPGTSGNRRSRWGDPEWDAAFYL